MSFYINFLHGGFEHLPCACQGLKCFRSLDFHGLRFLGFEAFQASGCRFFSMLTTPIRARGGDPHAFWGSVVLCSRFAAQNSRSTVCLSLAGVQGLGCYWVFRAYVPWGLRARRGPRLQVCRCLQGFMVFSGFKVGGVEVSKFNVVGVILCVVRFDILKVLKIWCS